MSNVNLDSVISLEDVVTLAKLPSPINSIWNHIPELKVGDSFIYRGIANNKNKLLFKHVETGIQVVLSPLLFLNHDRFYNGSRTENKTALYVMFDYEMFPYQGVGRKSVTARLGTIFSKFEKINKGYIVYSNSNKPYFVPAYAGLPICDIDYVEPEEVKEAFDALDAQLALEASVSSVVAPEEEEVVLESATISFERKASLNGFEFSSNSVADKVEAEVIRILSLDMSKEDKMNLLSLAVESLKKDNKEGSLSLHENT